MSPILVIGSSNTDMVINVPELPRPGQTIAGQDFQIFGGGKGANQAIAAKRAGAAVRFIAAIGDDDFGKSALQTFAAEGIDTSSIQILADTPSGVAMIFVDAAGENCIGVASGANARLTPEILQSQQYAFDDIAVLLMQLETPLETVAAAMQMAAARELPVILNPAPAQALSKDLLQGLYCITPNETEAELLSGIAVSDEASAIEAAEAMRQQGVQNVIVTLGAKGALLCNAAGTYFQPAETVEVVDTTAAGDTFNGVLAAMIAKGQPLQSAVKTAVHAATMSVQSAGAIASIPHLDP
jgi:ribokinase